MVEGTPVLDVKPYLPHLESLPNAKGGWAMEVNFSDIKVEFTPDTMEKLQKWSEKTGRSELKDVIVEVLKQDPRPVLYRGFESKESPYRNKHAFRLYEGDVHFEFISKNEVIVFDILF